MRTIERGKERVVDNDLDRGHVGSIDADRGQDDIVCIDGKQLVQTTLSSLWQHPK